MKHTLTLFGMAGLAVTLLSSNAFAQKPEEPKTKSKDRHIKMLKIEDGKKIELDTVLTDSAVFVWNGDTIGREMLGKDMDLSDFDGMKQFKVFVDGKDDDGKVMIYHSKGSKCCNPIGMQIDLDNNIEMLAGDEGDSIPKRIIIRKRMKNGDGDPFVFMNGKGHVPFAPVPPLPPVGMHRGKLAGQVIDLNDPNIISYQKKELSGGREKIEIVRKKSKKIEEMSFDFQIDDDVMAPEPPEMIKEFNHDGKNIKIREKAVKVDGKDGREVKVEVEHTENK